MLLPERFNVASFFLDRNLGPGRSERIAFVHEGRRYTYDEVAALANQAGNALAGLGVEIENRVALLMLDSPELAAAFWGAIKLGAVPVPLNTLLRGPDYVYLLNDSRAKVLIAHHALWEEIGPLQEQLRYLQHVVIVGESSLGGREFSAWIAGASPELEAADTSVDDAAFWLYSSGSTGFPKGTVHLQHDMVYCAELYARGVLDIREDDVCLSAAKLFFAYGLGNSLYFPAYVGASTVLFPGRPTPEGMFEAISTHRPTLFFGVPTLYAQMLAMEDAARRYDLSSLRLCVSAGEALPADIYRRWQERFGVEILDGIGTTEVLHIFISNRPGAVRPGSSGTLVPGYEARLVDERFQDVAEGELGSLMVSGDSTAAFYWNKHQKTKETMLGPWVLTGDKYTRDAEGYYWYAGRNDDMLKVGGIWVSPAEVEATLVEHPAVLEAAVVGKEDADQLVKPQAFVVLAPGHAPSVALARELQEHVRSRIAPYKYPRWVQFCDVLPKTATGKIQRYKLRT